jgi:thymidylate synthase (FAD)
MQVKLVSITTPTIDGINTADELIAYCARVSNPSNQLNTKTASKLIKYLIKHKHWSPFEMASMCVEIKTSRAIAAQILRHRSFSFQEFSQRYSEALELEFPELRLKADSNRQSSSETVKDAIMNRLLRWTLRSSFTVYKYLVNNGVAKETARMVLPLCTQTTLYMNGSLRSWIHYIEVRSEEGTQKEHREIALSVKEIIKQQFPTIYEALYGE